MSLLSKKISELQERTARAVMGGGDKAIAKQIAMGKLPARERINKLLDEGSFYEYDLFIEHDAREFGMENKSLAGDGVVTASRLQSMPRTLQLLEVLWVLCMQERLPR